MVSNALFKSWKTELLPYFGPLALCTVSTSNSVMFHKNDLYEYQTGVESRCCCFRCIATVGFNHNFLYFSTTGSMFIGQKSTQFNNLAIFLVVQIFFRLCKILVPNITVVRVQMYCVTNRSFGGTTFLVD
jgi:hypothetical protein